MPQWDCTGCWRSFDMSRDVADRRLESTTVYKPESVFEGYVCPNCGALLSNTDNA